MRFVLGNRLLVHAGGTEVHLLTLAEQLQGLGHEVCLYSPELGVFSDRVRRRGVEVVGELGELPADCDVVFSQDTLVVYDLAERYPAAFHVFRVCGDVFDFQIPPQLSGVVDMIVALSDRYERLARACAVEAPVVRLRIPIDSDRLSPAVPIRRRPRRAVLLGNYLDRDDLVSEAWGRHGVEVVRIGAHVQRYDLSGALADADIVVAKSRAALDAMACGRAVYLLDVFGGDGWVTPSSYPAFEADHFAGQATSRVIGVAELESDLADYDKGMGMANRDLIAQHHGARDHAIELVASILERRPMERPVAPLTELSRLTALQWSSTQLVRGMESELSGLVGRIQHLEHRAGEADAAIERAQTLERRVAEADAAVERHRSEFEAHAAQFDRMRATRAWRLAMRYWGARSALSPRRKPLLPRQ
jgi:hypothetical protein